ncbi:MAG: carbohydrate porin [Cyanobium sp. M30B3]|nr:MAG: carbohydrate porin [Cyanobium sp. M30B3]
MKPFQQLLLALAGTGLLAPLAATAQDASAVSSSAAISSYMEQQDIDRFRAWEAQNQVTSVSQFSDVRPTDWAYQALSNLVERYGCVAGYPNGTFKGRQAMTRYEAAALLNACLDRVTEVTDELKRLMAEFEKELAVLKGRVDTLEGKVETLEAQQFSTTTKLRGEVSFILGGSPDFNSPLRNSDGSRPADPNRTTFNYDARLSFDTSFSGKDLLRTRLRAGNFSSLPFGSSSQIFKLDKAEGTDDSVIIDRLFYRFPVSKGFNLTVGALVRNTEMISFVPTAYKSSILDFFQLAGASGTYNKATGAGVGLSWRQQVEKGNPYITFDANYVASSGYDDSTVGAFNSDSGINALAQLGIRGSSWGAAVAYRYGSEGSAIRVPNFSPGKLGDGQNTNSVSIAGYWSPIDAGWAPSISAGYGYNGGDGGFRDSQSWMVGLQWSDVFMEGNNAGVAFGMPPFNSGNDSESWLLEVFYKYQATDNISITPAFFYASDYRNNSGFGTWGGVIQTTFKF